MSAESRFTPSQSSTKPATESAIPKASARSRVQPARRQRTVRGAAHFAIGFALVPLVQRGGAGGDQAGAEDGVEQGQQRDIAEKFHQCAAPRRPKK